jgi:hypothetical protein
MISYQNALVYAVTGALSRFVSEEDTETTGATGLMNWFTNSATRRRAISIAWAGFVLVAFLLTVFTTPALRSLVLSSTVWTIGFWSIVWGIVVGFTFGLVLPAKAVTAITGIAGGLTLSDLTSGTYLTWLDSLVKQIAGLVTRPSDTPDLFALRLYVILFLIFAALVCAPAFFLD